MRRLAAILALVLGLTLLAAPPASAAVAGHLENRASGSAAAPGNLIGIETRLSERSVRENIALGYDIASDDAVAARGLTAASGTGGEVLPMTVVKMLPKGTAGGIVDEARALTFATGNEHALVRLATGERALVSGGPGGISFSEGQITRIIGHTHPYGFGSIGPSGADFDALSALDQTHSYVLDGAGQIIRFGP